MTTIRMKTQEEHPSPYPLRPYASRVSAQWCAKCGHKRSNHLAESAGRLGECMDWDAPNRKACPCSRFNPEHEFGQKKLV